MNNNLTILSGHHIKPRIGMRIYNKFLDLKGIIYYVDKNLSFGYMNTERNPVGGGDIHYWNTGAYIIHINSLKYNTRLIFID